LRQLPGIGPYTAGAIACFAFEQDVAFMDTNIRRVLRRLLVGPEQAPPTSSDKALLKLATALIPTDQGWAWNQALIELGALICTSTTPTCWRCPLQQHCNAYAVWQRADETVLHGYTQQARQPRGTRKVAEQKSAPFVGSNRYYRGRLITCLRNLPDGERIAVAQLGPLIKEDFDPEYDQRWLRELVEKLVYDGLATLEHDSVSLPAT
jgi:A/G-specific adenine glycosylase